MIVGHIFFDATQDIIQRTGQHWGPLPNLYAPVGIGVLVVVCTIWREMRSAGARSNRHNDSGASHMGLDHEA